MAGTVDGGPLLSVVVPFHDVEGYIRACLESLRDQALAAIEVVMVDDGSTDGSLGVAEEFAAADPRFRILRQANQGLGPARNTGVAAARGRYLTFVDSDDLVTRDGLATLVDSLERTGSDWAGGGAARLDAYGVRGSWSHQERYREERLATCIRDYPLLAADRLVTAKVYRRDFWVDQGLVFPAMRYEDFPMALAANLAATAVDLLPVRTYYWRERHRQDSITQRAADLDNIEDRVRSDDMVLDRLEADFPAGLGPVRALLAEVDLVVLLDAFAGAGRRDARRLLELARHLAGRIGAEALSARPPAERIRHLALSGGDLRTLRRLAVRRGTGRRFLPSVVPVDPPERSASGGTPAPKEWRFDWPSVPEALVPEDARTWTPDLARLTLATTAIRLADDELRVSGTATLAPLPQAWETELDVTLHRTVEGFPEVEDSGLRLERLPVPDGAAGWADTGFRLVLPVGRLAALADEGGGLHLEVTARASDVTRRDKLQGPCPGSPQWPPMVPVGQGAAGVVSATGWGILLLNWRRDLGAVTSARQVDDRLVLRLRLPEDARLAGAVLELDGRPVPTVVSGTDTVSVPVAGLAPDRAVEPVPAARIGHLGVRLADGREVALQAMAGPGPVMQQGPVREVRLSRTTGGYCAVLDSTDYVHADAVEVDGNRLVVSGRSAATIALEWSREDRDGPVRVPGALGWGEAGPAGVRAWTFSCPLRSLSGAAGTRYVLLARRGDDVEPLAVHVDPQLAGELPSVLGTWQVGYRRRSEHPTGALVVDRLPGPARRPRGGWWSRSAGNASR